MESTDVPVMPKDTTAADRGRRHKPKKLNVGIVGGGIAGLYTAIYLQRKGHGVHIFEGTERIGGRVHTHYFTPDRDQYYEAGAMRIPDNKFQTIFFELVEYINKRVAAERQIKLIDYILTTNDNLVYVNGVRPQVTAFDTTPSTIGWPDIKPEKYQTWKAGDLLQLAVGQLIEELINATDFEAAFRSIVDRFDQYTFRYYCVDVVGWNNSLVNFVETMTSQTNQFNLSVPELVMQSLDFGVKHWQTIEGGMSRLPEAMARLVGLENITFGARVTGIKLCGRKGRKASIITTGYNGTLEVEFDRVVLAIPPAALRMIVHRPRWEPKKEMAIRAIHFEPLYKMGLRFKTRFWERVTPRPSVGGQSTTDLPIRWIVYPSNGIRANEVPSRDTTGVLLVYSWMTDATNWLPLNPLERRNVAMSCLAEVYNGKKDVDGKTIDVHKLYIESADHVWASSTATGDAIFLPGQFKEHFDVARKSEGPIYFAGEHLSFHHTWIAGAAHSALDVVRDMLKKKDLPPLKLPNSTAPTQGEPESEISHGVKAPFHFQPNNPMFLVYDPTPEGNQPRDFSVHRGGPGGSDDDDSDYDLEEHGVEAGRPVNKLPGYLGMLDKNALGVVSAHITSPSAVASWDMGQVRFS
ncbi:hypothetical protein B0T25DRAFT_603183 [Lasiosphaeria hispida]|uniref:Amine oxidase domain-containing protein n=1 Tax=Lasiosphaeria hispida TaxID=260671 RepID=A0AAJ0HKY2_9PEZI|nr:hypothetical protein B0T25DRAFT_603183 [Lasiosphaeria hispida]